MRTLDPRILTTFPYPVAYPYSLVFAEHELPSKRRWALWFTVYQLLRMVGLSLVSQYLREPVNEKAPQSITTLNRAIMALRSPHFSDWISLVGALRRYLPQVGVSPLFSQLDATLATLTAVRRRPFGINGQFDLPPLEALLALRNGIAHGGVPDESVAATHVYHYLSDLQQILSAFTWLGDYTLVARGENVEDIPDRPVRVLRGVVPTEVMPDRLPPDLQEALKESSVILVAPDSRIVPLFPFFHPFVGSEPVYLYDGHVAIHVESTQQSERSTVQYLGVYQSVSDAGPVEDLRVLLAARQVSFALRKEQTAPWTIADSAADFSRRTMSDLIGTKYFPSCYIPFSELEGHFQRFLTISEPSQWPTDTTRTRYANGLILVGPAGAGKTAFLARQVVTLLAEPSVQINSENPNLVLFLRSDSITERPQGMSLFHTITEKLGIVVEGTLRTKATEKHSHRGFSGFRELLDHLHRQWKNDRVPGRRFIIVLDALNEAPQAELIVREALALVKDAACYPWLKVVLSLRQEWLSLLFGKFGAQEKDPLEGLRPVLYVTNTGGEKSTRGLPVVTLELFGEDHARSVYERYQERTHTVDPDATLSSIPACLTLWADLPPETRALLRNPLHLHLFMEAFDGRRADPVATAIALFQRYVERALQERPSLRLAITAVMTHLLRDSARSSANLSDDDAHAIRRAWASSLSPTEARLSLSPIEALVHEGFMRKRVRDEGGGYGFVFQTVAEYLLYRDLTENRPPEEEIVSYWTRKTHAVPGFPEYTGAFGFLLREWAERGDYSAIVRLVEATPQWLRDVLTTFLIEHARHDHKPGQGSSTAQVTAQTLAISGGEKCVEALFNAGVQLAQTRFASTAAVYFATGTDRAESLWRDDPQHFHLGYLLGVGLNRLGDQYSDAGDSTLAKHAYQRALTVLESLCRAHPTNLTFGFEFAMAWDNLATVLAQTGQGSEAESAYREAITLYQALREAFPDKVILDKQLGWALSRYGVFLEIIGRIPEAEKLHRQAIATFELLGKTHPNDREIGSILSRALTNLGTMLDNTERWPEAENAYLRAVATLEALWADSPDHTDLGHSLAVVLLNLGGMLNERGRGYEAEQAFQRSVSLCGSLLRENPTAHAPELTCGKVLMNLGLLASGQGNWAVAEQYYHRAAALFRALWAANPHYTEAGQGLADTLTNLGKVLWEIGHLEEAIHTARESVVLYERLWQTSPMTVTLGDALADALHNLLVGLFNTGRESEADQIAVRIVELRRVLWTANPNDIELTMQYADTLCAVQRFAEASRLLDSVLAQLPEHPQASALRRNIAAHLVKTKNNNK